MRVWVGGVLVFVELLLPQGLFVWHEKTWLVSLTFPACLRTLFIHSLLAELPCFCVPEGLWYFPDNVASELSTMLILYTIFPLAGICSMQVDLPILIYAQQMAQYASNNFILKMCVSNRNLDWMWELGVNKESLAGLPGRIAEDTCGGCHSKVAAISIGWSLNILWRSDEVGWGGWLDWGTLKWHSCNIEVNLA